MEMNTVTGILNTTLALIFTWIGYKTGRIIWKYTPYSYPNARIRAMEARLLTEQRLSELAESKTLDNFVMNLEDSDYKPYMSKLDSYTAETIDRAFDEAIADTYTLMFRILPRRVRQFFNLLLEGWDVRNISSVIKAKLYGEVARDYVSELGTMVEKIKAMAEAKTMEEILVILEGTEYEEVYQKLLLREISVEEFETELYRMHYLKLLNFALSGGDEERKILEEFVKLRIDKINILTILRAKLHGLGSEKIKSMLLMEGSLSQRTIETLLNVEDLSMALAELDSTKYSGIVREAREELEKGNLASFEVAFEKFIRRKMIEFTRFYPLSVAVPISYILQKESEVRKLKAIAKLIEDRIKPEEIKTIIGGIP